VIVFLLAVSLLFGGLRAPWGAALGCAAVAAALWIRRPPVGAAKAWLPWLGWATLCAGVSASPLSGLAPLSRWAATLGMAALAGEWSESDRRDWLKSVLMCGGILAVAALWTGARHAEFHSAMTGLLPPYYNYTAFALAAAAAAAITSASHPESPRGAGRLTAYVVAAVAFVCILLAHSRGALLGLAAAAVVWSGRRYGVKALVAAACVCALAGGLAGRKILFKAERARGDARTGIWRSAILVARESPWFGEGPGNFGAGYRRHPVAVPGAAARYGLATDYAHSEPLQAAGETGLVGLLLWLGAALWSLRALWGPADDDPIREAAVAAAAAMAVQLLVDDMLQIPGLAFLFFTTLAVTRAPSAGTRWPRCGAAVVLALSLAAGAVSWAAARGPAAAARLFRTDPTPVEDLAYATRGRADLADPLWAEAARRAPNNAVYPWRRAQLAAACGRWSESEALAALAVEIEPNFLRARLARVQALIKLGTSSQVECGEIRRRLAAFPGVAENGYERVVSELDSAERAELLRLCP
jgi:O-antigen ligase